MLAAIAPERLAAEGEALRRPPIITTLYDLIAALSAASEAGEEALVTAAVASLCHAGRLRFLPKQVLLDEAEHWGADCIFVGAHGLSRIERFLLGSVSAAVAARAHCSVEVVRPRRTR